MSLSTVFLALVTFVIGALIPRDKSLKVRVGLGLIGAVTVSIVAGLWPSASDAAVQPAPTTDGEWPYLLTFIIFAPLVASVAVLFLPRQGLRTIRYFTYAAMGLTFVASLWTLTVPMTAGWHFQHVTEWIPSLGIRYHVALDGISLWMVLLTTFMTPIAAFASFGSIKTRVKELCFSFLLLEAAMLGAFVSLDLFLFYIFWELMLVPMYLMIGIWGGSEKIKAAVKFFLFTMAGSMLLLAAMVYLVWTHQRITGEYSFDYLALSRVMLPKSAQFICFWGFSIAFFVKVPMWPVHTWLPDAHVQAPTGGSVILAAVMLKLGTYAYMRFSMLLFPYAASYYAPHVAGVAILGGIVWAALVAWKQDDVKKLIAYSSVAHLGYIMLGLFGATHAGMQGAVIQMVNHGISTGALFLLVGVIYDRKHTRLVKDFGGIAKKMPVYATLFLIATFASIGVPGTNGFVGEFMVIMGTFGSRDLGNFAGVHAVGAAFGVILAAVYMLSVVQKVFFGKLDAKNDNLTDISGREILALAPLTLMIFVIGFFPNVLLSRSSAAVESLRTQYNSIAQPQRELYAPKNAVEPPARLLPVSMFEPRFLGGAPSWAVDKPAAEASEPAEAAPTAPAPTPPAAATAAPRPPRVLRQPAATAAPGVAPGVAPGAAQPPAAVPPAAVPPRPAAPPRPAVQPRRPPAPAVAPRPPAPGVRPTTPPGVNPPAPPAPAPGGGQP